MTETTPATRPRTWWPRVRRPAPPPTRLDTDDEAQYRPVDLALLRRMLVWLWPYRAQYGLGIGLGLVMVVLELLSPLFMGRIVDLTTGYVTGQRAITATQAVTRLAGLVALWGGVLAVAVILQRATIIIMTRAGETVQFDLRRALFAHLQKLSMSYYDRTKLGRIISRCTSDLNGMRDINVWGIDTVVKNLVIMLVAASMLLATEPRLFLAVVWLAPLLYVTNRYFRKKLSHAHQVAREGYTRVATNLAENITGVRVVTAFARQDWNLRVFNTLQDANTRNNVQASRLNGIYQPTLQLMGLTGRVIILLLGGYLVTTGRITGVGAVVAAFLYWDHFMGPILTFGNFHNQLMMALAGAERIVNLLDTQPDVRDTGSAYPLPAIQGQVVFERVTFGYKPEQPVLHDVSFEAQPGQTIALVGHTGSGKSTIISLIARFYQPQSGRILVDGHDIQHVTGASLHEQTGMVLQSNFLFTGTVLENIRYARPTATEAEVIAAAEALGCHEALASLADGYATKVGERGASLSLGQRQLVCFTRAFLANPRILLLDEATSSIDSVTEMLVQRSLARLLENRTTFVVAHRLSTITRADAILVIDHGRLIEHGTHPQLIRADGKYAALYRQFVAGVAM